MGLRDSWDMFYHPEKMPGKKIPGCEEFHDANSHHSKVTATPNPLIDHHFSNETSNFLGEKTHFQTDLFK
jgi:hypothetical protein